jgi:phosphoribosylformylglycinamidine (FGAM) synthase PurS component
MNLPLVLDIATSLIFIYLIFSLLASEIQELLSTILQWRAIHLRKSIEILLTGGDDSLEKERIKAIVDDLYNNPLIQNINQESKKGIENLSRYLIWQTGRFYRMLTHQETTNFGQQLRQDKTVKDKHTAPSYIHSETFAVTLLAQLNMGKLAQKISNIKLINFKEQEIKLEIENNISLLNVSETTRSALKAELSKLGKKIDNIFLYFKAGKMTLMSSLHQIEFAVEKYLATSENHFAPDEATSKEQFIEEITALKQYIFTNPEELVKRLKPGLAEIINILNKGEQAYKEVKATIQDKNSEVYIAYQKIEEEIGQLISKLPESARESLCILAERAQIKANTVEDELNQFKKEIEVWFERSMERASGVYKRNAKGVAFLIGLFIATAANADTFHIINRLAKDTPLRQVITQNAGQLVSEENCPTTEAQDSSKSDPTKESLSKLDCLRNQVNQSLEHIAFPIGRSTENLQQQEDESKGWFFPPLRRFLGWILSGVAISMGAPFWFELLNKIINVRNTGPKPVASTKKD